MTWSEFKAFVESKGLKDEMVIGYIDVDFVASDDLEGVEVLITDDIRAASRLVVAIKDGGAVRRTQPGPGRTL